VGGTLDEGHDVGFGAIDASTLSVILQRGSRRSPPAIWPAPSCSSGPRHRTRGDSARRVHTHTIEFGSLLLPFRSRFSNEKTPCSSCRRNGGDGGVNLATESDERWLRTKRSVHWTVVLLAVLVLSRPASRIPSVTDRVIRKSTPAPHSSVGSPQRTPRAGPSRPLAQRLRADHPGRFLHYGSD
jgi:hypothetical protein